MPDYDPTHHTIVAMDVVGSGALDDRQLLAVRGDLRAIVSGVLGKQSIALEAIHHDDLGDGLRLIVPAVVTPRAMLDPFIPALDRALRGRDTRRTGPLRLRVAVHLGLLHRDGGAWAGEPLVHCARLLDARSVRDVVQLNPSAAVVLVVSQAMYDAVVRHGYGLDRAGYHEVAVREKETVTAGWMFLPGCADPVWPDDGGRAGKPGAQPAREHPDADAGAKAGDAGAGCGPVQVNVARDNGVIFAVQGGSQVIQRDH
jgi:hypothetical protein